ncbi:MAG: N-acetylmuramoyl-L-alanine amidase [Desulfosarcina sp.]|nr:N-acetylmuramoyl-L-alanine amidase [Desulfosarcina sp.]
MAAYKPLPLFRARVLVTLVVLFCLAGTFFLPSCKAQAATIVLDPGHGGYDGGAPSGNEFAEKQFTLALAQKIAGLLAARHRVELTRSSDIEMAPADRAAVANHLQADLMISLHAAVAPYCSNRTAAVYYHNDDRLSIPSGTSIQDTAIESDTGRPAWFRLQIRHQHQSQHLAAMIKRSIGETGAFDSVTVSGVPLVTLMGADLPAVLVEVGCIHPAAAPDPKTLTEQLNGYAESIANAIETAVAGLAQ